MFCLYEFQPLIILFLTFFKKSYKTLFNYHYMQEMNQFSIYQSHSAKIREWKNLPKKCVFYSGGEPKAPSSDKIAKVEARTETYFFSVLLNFIFTY